MNNMNAKVDILSKKTDSVIAQLNNVFFKYAQTSTEASILNDVSMQLKQGECVLLTGISGCGKTTITRLFNGLIPHYYEGDLQGNVIVEDANIASLPIYEISKRVSTVFQNPKSQFFNLDTTSEIVFFLENMGSSFEKMKERLTFVSKFLNIEHLLDRNIFNLSGGEKQMIAIASALATNSDLIVFDEPTSNLDLHYIEKIASVLSLLKEKGKTLLISEHRLYFLTNIIDRAILIKNGKVEHVFSQKEFASLSPQTRKALLLRPINMKDSFFENFNDLHVKSNVDQEGGHISDQLIIKELTYRFPTQRVDFLCCKDIKLQFGKVIALVGKNGQGKSTFAQCLIGLIKSGRDYVFLNDKRMSRKSRLRLSYLVMQDVGYQLFTESVQEEVELGKNKIKRSHQEDKEYFNVENILQFMKLSELKDRHPLSLSGGQKQRVSIASAISADAKIIVMDEPTSGMDYFHMKETASLINKVRCPEKLIIIISHDFEFLNLVADDIILMEKGQVTSHSPFTKDKAYEIFEYLKK